MKNDVIIQWKTGENQNGDCKYYKIIHTMKMKRFTAKVTPSAAKLKYLSCILLVANNVEQNLWIFRKDENEIITIRGIRCGKVKWSGKWQNKMKKKRNERKLKERKQSSLNSTLKFYVMMFDYDNTLQCHTTPDPPLHARFHPLFHYIPSIPFHSGKREARTSPDSQRTITNRKGKEWTAATLLSPRYPVHTQPVILLFMYFSPRAMFSLSNL